MLISQKGIDLIKKFEGCVLHSYPDVAGVYTIGYGHTANVKVGQTITQAQAEELLKNDLVEYASKVQDLIENGTIIFNVNQNMFDALVSFCYNLGQGNLILLVSKRTVSEVAEHMTLYVHAGGQIIQGLLNRRLAEKQLFLSPFVQNFQTYKVCRGDNLTLIAKRLNTTVTHLADINKISNINLIKVGQVLKY